MATKKDNKRDNTIQIEKVTLWVHVPDYGRPDWSSPALDHVVEAVQKDTEIDLIDYDSQTYGLYPISPRDDEVPA